jgi:molybdenum-dependent DNA-binding transcriptional regulator ModE
METNQVRYFLALCEEQSFTRAAKRCGVSQPSVSNAIKRLEEELGGDLFHRTKNGAKLSPLGVAIRPYLDQINECAEDARRRAAYISTADMVTIPTRAKFARKIFYGTAIAACALLIGVLFGQQPFSGWQRAMANTTVDVAALEATIDSKHLPRQALPSEVYQ